jgi:hypothetical protein
MKSALIRRGNMPGYKENNVPAVSAPKEIHRLDEKKMVVLVKFEL